MLVAGVDEAAVGFVRKNHDAAVADGASNGENLGRPVGVISLRSGFGERITRATDDLHARARADNTTSPIARPCATWGKTIRNITAGRNTKAGTIASGAPIRNGAFPLFCSHGSARGWNRVIASSHHRVIWRSNSRRNKWGVGF